MKKVIVYQIYYNVHKMFSPMSLLKSMGWEFNANDYKVVFNGELEVEDAEDVYVRCNIGQKPNGYKGHSLSISDVVYIDGKYLFCDSFGFIDVTDKWNVGESK